MSHGVTLASPEGVHRAANYEHAARAGDFVFVAGQIAKDAAGQWVGLGDAALQARQCWRNVLEILDHFGVGPADTVKVTTMLVDRADAPAVTAERFAALGPYRPPHTGVIVVGLGSSEVRVEVEVVAYVPERR